EFSPWVRRATTGSIALLIGIATCGLVPRNLGEIRFTNGPALRHFAAQLCSGFPEGRSVALSDDPALLWLAQGEMASHRRAKDPILLDTHALEWSQYHSFMSNRFKSRWPMPVPAN